MTEVPNAVSFVSLTGPSAPRRCPNDGVVLTATASPPFASALVWSTGVTTTGSTGSITVYSDGLYTASAIAPCAASSTPFYVLPAQHEFSVVVVVGTLNSTRCGNDHVELSAQTFNIAGPFTYLWSNGASQWIASFVGLVSKIYCLCYCCCCCLCYCCCLYCCCLCWIFLCAQLCVRNDDGINQSCGWHVHCSR